MAVTENKTFQKQLFDLGWRRYGQGEGDPYYKVILDASVFGIRDLNGDFNTKGEFEIYSMFNRSFESIKGIEEIFKVNRFKVEWGITSRYGSKTIE